MALGDMFLKVDGIKGDSQDTTHTNEIDVVNWSWGMRSNTSMGGAGASGKSTVNELKITKRVDNASTALMSVMRNNGNIKKVVLTVRKAGGNPLEYFMITLQNARITSIDVESGTTGEESDLVERLSFAFNRINIEYVPQGADGQPRGSTTFMTEID